MEYISQESAEELFNKYSDYIFKTAFMLTRSQSLADDVTQETFLRIFKSYHTYDQTKPLKPWIYKVALNTLRELKRKQKWLIFSEYLPEQLDNSKLDNE